LDRVTKETLTDFKIRTTQNEAAHLIGAIVNLPLLGAFLLNGNAIGVGLATAYIAVDGSFSILQRYNRTRIINSKIFKRVKKSSNQEKE
jgi:hypothetical protein